MDSCATAFEEARHPIGPLSDWPAGTAPHLGDLVVVNTFVQCSTHSMTCRSPEPAAFARRRADSDWTGVRDKEAAFLMSLGGSIAKGMPEFGLPAACDADCGGWTPDTFGAVDAQAMEYYDCATGAWQHCTFDAAVDGSAEHAPCGFSEWAEAAQATEPSSPKTSETGKAASNAVSNESTRAPSEDGDERRLDPDDDTIVTLAALRSKYSGRFSEAQVLEYWKCLDAC